MTVATRARMAAAGASGSGLSPSQISGLAAWYAADQIAGPPSDGAALATWADVSGNARDVAQGTGGFQPLYKTAILNGKPVVRFDGNDDFLFSSSFTTLTQPNMIVVVAKFASVVASQQILVDGNGSTNRNILLMSNSLWKYWAGSFVSSATAPDTAWHVLTALYTGAGSLLRLDGTEIASGSPGTNGIGGIYLGRWSDTNDSNFGGDMAEVCVYNAAPTTLERQQLERHLGAKYGIVVA